MFMENIDRKFKIIAHCKAHQHRYTEANAVLFVAKDKAFLAVLPEYRRICQELGAKEDQLKGIDLLIERVKRFQAENPDKIKVPDVDPLLEADVLKDNESA